MISQYSNSNTSRQSRVLGRFMVKSSASIAICILCVCLQSWLVSQTAVYAMKLPTPFQLIGQIVCSYYTYVVKFF